MFTFFEAIPGRSNYTLRPADKAVVEAECQEAGMEVETLPMPSISSQAGNPLVTEVVDAHSLKIVGWDVDPSLAGDWDNLLERLEKYYKCSFSFSF